MDDQALYWTLSTLPQVGALLIAFVGLFGLTSLNEASRQRAQVEENAKEKFLSLRGYNEPGPLHGMGHQQIRSMPGGQFMEGLVSVLKWPSAREMENLRWYVNQWRPIERQIRHMRRLLLVFVAWNLLIVLLSLSLLPFVPRLVKYPGVSIALVIAAASMVLITGSLVFEALFPRRL